MNTKQSDECQYQNTHQDLLRMSHPLFYQVDFISRMNSIKYFPISKLVKGLGGIENPFVYSHNLL